MACQDIYRAMTQQANNKTTEQLMDMPSLSDRTSLSDIFVSYNLDKNVRIIDVACGVGIVAEEIGRFGYRNIDGLDPQKGYITVVEARGLYKVQNVLRTTPVLFINIILENNGWV